MGPPVPPFGMNDMTPFWFLALRLFLIAAGLYYMIEGAANLLAGPATNNKVWIVGRTIRALLGLALIGVGLIA